MKRWILRRTRRKTEKTKTPTPCSSSSACTTISSPVTRTTRCSDQKIMHRRRRLSHTASPMPTRKAVPLKPRASLRKTG